MQELTQTLTVSKPMPLAPPVTMATLPERSGMSFTWNLVFGGKASWMNATSADIKDPMCEATKMNKVAFRWERH